MLITFPPFTDPGIIPVKLPKIALLTNSNASVDICNNKRVNFMNNDITASTKESMMPVMGPGLPIVFSNILPSPF